VPLDLLSDAEARDLLAARLGADRLAAEPAAGQEIVAGCARLPLALAIAAARVATEPTMSLATLVEAFRGERARLDVLTGDDPATDVRSVLSWSLRSLGPAAARLFRLLGLHPGPDIATAAAASLGGLPEPAARPVLAELVRARLLDEPTPGRFAFHDLLRAYAAELAEASDSAADRAAGVRRVLDHYLHTGHAAALRLEPYREPLTLGVPGEGVSPTLVADHAAALAWFDAERAALLAVIRHAAAAGRDAHAWQLVWTVTSYLDRRGLWREQAQVQEIALNAGHRLGDRAGEAHARRGLARAYCRLGRLDDAVPQLDAALDLFGALRDHAGQARVHLDLGWLYGRRDDPAGALRHAEAALALYRTANHHTGQARALNNASWYHCQVGDFAAALACCEEALALHLGAGDRHGQSAAWDSLGYIRAQLGDREDAVRCYGRALAMFREDGDRYDEATVLVHLGDVHATADDRATARRCWRDAVDIFDELDHPDGDRFRSRLADEDVPTLR
jgi:tetratricopeptide (TPR) repeat protein